MVVEPLSIAASVGGFISLSITLATKVCDFYGRYVGAAHDLESFIRLLRGLQDIVNKYASLIKGDKLLIEMTPALDDCKKELQSINNKFEKYMDPEPLKSARKRAKWALAVATSVNGARVKLEGAKSNLAIAFSQAQYDVTRQGFEDVEESLDRNFQSLGRNVQTLGDGVQQILTLQQRTIPASFTPPPPTNAERFFDHTLPGSPEVFVYTDEKPARPEERLPYLIDEYHRIESSEGEVEDIRFKGSGMSGTSVLPTVGDRSWHLGPAEDFVGIDNSYSSYQSPGHAPSHEGYSSYKSHDPAVVPSTVRSNSWEAHPAPEQTSGQDGYGTYEQRQNPEFVQGSSSRPWEEARQSDVPAPTTSYQSVRRYRQDLKAKDRWLVYPPPEDRKDLL